MYVVLKNPLQNLTFLNCNPHPEHPKADFYTSDYLKNIKGTHNFYVEMIRLGCICIKKNLEYRKRDGNE